MAVMEGIGCLLVALGVPFALFVTTIAHDSLKIIIMTFSSFFWLLALATSSLLWFAVVPLRAQIAFSVPFAVIFQELSRYGLYRLFKKAQNGFKQLTNSSRSSPVGITVEGTLFSNVTLFAYVAGLGYGIIYAVIAIANVVADTMGPGSVGVDYGTYYFPLNSALMALIFALLHICWTVIFFDACEKRSVWKASYVVFSHMLVSCLTLLNQQEVIAQPQVYAATTLPSCFVLFLSIAVVIRFVFDYDTFRRNLHTVIQSRA